MEKVFIDTNVALDYYLQRKDFVDEAKSFFLLGFSRRCALCLSSLSFSNIAYISRKQVSRDDTYSLLGSLAQVVNVSPVDKKAVQQAIELRAYDFEDALQYFPAKAVKSDCIVTRNVRDFYFSDIPVLSPHDFLEMQS